MHTKFLAGLNIQVVLVNLHIGLSKHTILNDIKMHKLCHTLMHNRLIVVLFFQIGWGYLVSACFICIWTLRLDTKLGKPMLYTTPEAMLAGSAYTFSPTVVPLLCIWAILFQAVCVPLWSLFYFVLRPWGSVTGRSRVWGLTLSGLSGARHWRAAVNWDLQGLFLLDLAIDLLLKPTHLLLQLTNEIHYSLTDTVREKENWEKHLEREGIL